MLVSARQTVSKKVHEGFESPRALNSESLNQGSEVPIEAALLEPRSVAS